MFNFILHTFRDTTTRDDDGWCPIITDYICSRNLEGVDRNAKQKDR